MEDVVRREKGGHRGPLISEAPSRGLEPASRFDYDPAVNEGLLRFETLRRWPAFDCVVSQRRGGASPAPYTSLNLGFAVGDDRRAVIENRERLFRLAGVDPDHVVSCEQVHGGVVAHVGPDDGGRGALEPETAVSQCDGLLTTSPGLRVLVQSADCPLVAIFAPPDRGVAVVHSGWKGTVARIAPTAVHQLETATGNPAHDFRATLAPAIGACCYEVGTEVLRAMEPFGVTARRSPRPGHGFLCLRQVIVRQLESAGVPPQHIEVSDDCTRCREDLYYSYRRCGPRTGRFGLLAGIR